METTENHADQSAEWKKKKRKRQKKRCNALENNYLDDKLLENGSLSCPDQSKIPHPNKEHVHSYSEAAEMDSTRMEKNHDVLMGNSLILEELSSFSKSTDSNSMKKKGELDEVNIFSLEAKSIKTYQRKKSVKTYERKKKMLLDSSRSSLELSKDNGFSTSIQVLQNSVMKETSVNCSDNTPTSERNKANVKYEVEFIKVQKTVLEFDVSEGKKFTSLESGGTKEHVCASSLDLVHKEDNSSESCKDGRSTLSPAVEDIPIGESSANFSDKKPTSKKRIRKMKAKPSTHGDEASEEKSSCDPSAKQLEQRNALERSVEGCHVFGEASPSECKMEGKIPSLSNVDVRKDAISFVVINKEVKASHSSPERAPIGESSANFSDKKPTSKKRIRKMKAKPNTHGDEASEDKSSCDPSAKQLEQRNALERSVEGCHVFGEASPSECKMEGKIPSRSNVDVRKDAISLVVINKEVEASHSSPERAPIGESSANFSDKKPTSKKRIRKMKAKPSTHGDEASEDKSSCDPSAKQLEQRNSLERSVEGCHVFGEASPSECKMEGKIPSLSNVDVRKDAISLVVINKEVEASHSSPERAPIDESSANFSDQKSTSKKRMRKMKAKHSTHGDEASEDKLSCDPSATQLEQRNALERSVEGCHVFGEASPSECKMEEKIPSLSNVDVRKDAISFVVINKEVEVSHSSPERAPISCSRRKLLILDLNGLLADIVSFVPDGYKVDKKIAQKALFKRPFCDDFLKFCFERFDVGVWSSRTKRNVDSVVDFLMGDMKNNLRFCWDQSHCTETGYNTVEDNHKPLILKELKKLWEKHEPNLPWEKGYYNESNTLLLDDSPYKALRNPPHTAVFPYSYRFQDTNDNSLGPGGDLRVYLEGLVMAEDIQKYVQQHPFGQRAITKANTSWVFYLKVIGTNISTRR